MSDQPGETPLLELARRVPTDLRGEWEMQWAEDGTPTGHSMAPVGSYVHRLADEVERLQIQIDASRNEHAELVALRSAHDNLKERHEALRQQYAAKDAYTGKVNDDNKSLQSRLVSLLNHWREFGPEYGFDELIETSCGHYLSNDETRRD